MRGLIPISWTNDNEQPREWRKLLQVLGAPNVNASRPGAIQPNDKVTVTKDVEVSENFQDEELEEDYWQFLLESINDQTCTPIIGPGIYSETFPFKSLIQDWSASIEYPFSDVKSLPLAAQFRSLKFGAIEPKGKIIKRIEQLAVPDFTNLNEPHQILASLPLPYYITTNYDDFIFKALQFHKKNPRRDLCRWDDPLNCEQYPFLKLVIFRI